MTTLIGLVSDTHTPMRLRELPPSLFAALEGVDLVLHAGDVGELWVLDQLGSLAPVIAVHGNDDSADAQCSLPYKTVVANSGVRILLWHSHYEDRQEEFASRKEDAFLPKLRRIAAEALSAGAAIAVFGHWHIPLVRQVDGVTIVNPGAVASGNAISRQRHQTVAKLKLTGDGSASIRHVNLADLHEPYDPWVEWDAGFKVNLRRYSESILAPELLDRLPSMLAKITREEQDLLRSLVLPLARRCWDGELDLIDEELLRSELAGEASLTADQRLRFQTMLD